MNRKTMLCMISIIAIVVMSMFSGCVDDDASDDGTATNDTVEGDEATTQVDTADEESNTDESTKKGAEV